MRVDKVIAEAPMFVRTNLGTYRGISRTFYPKWEGWGLLDRELFNEAERLAVEFYKNFYFYRFKFDLLKDNNLMETLLIFSILEGPKKALQKIHKVFPESANMEFSSALATFLNTQNSTAYKLLILELLEFYEYTGRLNEASWLLKPYRQIILSELAQVNNP